MVKNHVIPVSYTMFNLSMFNIVQPDTQVAFAQRRLRMAVHLTTCAQNFLEPLEAAKDWRLALEGFGILRSWFTNVYYVYPLVICYSLLLKMAIEIVDVPVENCVFHSYMLIYRRVLMVYWYSVEPCPIITAHNCDSLIWQLRPHEVQQNGCLKMAAIPVPNVLTSPNGSQDVTSLTT